MAEEEVMDNRSQPEQNVIPDSHSLQYYYGKLFPYAEICKWMSYGHDRKHPACDQSYFGRREFSFTLDGEIYLRNQSFSGAAQLQNFMKDKCPIKFDIGAVYSVELAKRHAYAGDNVVIPVEKELVFDIDITDYDDVRYCCSGADVCLKCWPLMTIAIKVIDTSLRGHVGVAGMGIHNLLHHLKDSVFYDLGYNHILWVFSGRRGVHCWVCDARARRSTNELRATITESFHVFKGNENSHKKTFLGGAVNPFLVNSYEKFLRPFFEETLLCSQDLLVIEERFEKILQMIPDESIQAELRGKWKENPRSSISKGDLNVTRWEQLKRLVQQSRKRKAGLRTCIAEIVFHYTYPRMDIRVSKDIKHLLKAPFCVHPKTGRICVPIDPDHCEEFDPTAVPTLSTLLQELNCGGLRGDMGNELDRTSLGKSVKFFTSSLLQPLLQSSKEEIESAYKEKLQQQKNQLSW